MNVDNVLQFKRKPPPEHEEHTAMVGQIEFEDYCDDKTLDFEVRAVFAPAASRYWIVVDGEPDTADSLPFHKLNKCFPSGTPETVIRQWVLDSIQRHFCGARVDLV